MGGVQLKNEVRLMKQDMKLFQDTVEMFEDSLSSAGHISSAKPASASKKSKKSQIPLLVLIVTMALPRGVMGLSAVCDCGIS